MKNKRFVYTILEFISYDGPLSITEIKTFKNKYNRYTITNKNQYSINLTGGYNREKHVLYIDSILEISVEELFKKNQQINTTILNILKDYLSKHYVSTTINKDDSDVTELPDQMKYVYITKYDSWKPKIRYERENLCIMHKNITTKIWNTSSIHNLEELEKYLNNSLCTIHSSLAMLIDGRMGLAFTLVLQDSGKKVRILLTPKKGYTIDILDVSTADKHFQSRLL